MSKPLFEDVMELVDINQKSLLNELKRLHPDKNEAIILGYVKAILEEIIHNHCEKNDNAVEEITAGYEMACDIMDPGPNYEQEIYNQLNHLVEYTPDLSDKIEDIRYLVTELARLK